jgi:hypothetical protein
MNKKRTSTINIYSVMKIIDNQMKEKQYIIFLYQYLMGGIPIII